MREMNDKLQQMFAEEAASVARGEGVPAQTREHRAVGGANVPPPLPEVVGLGGMKEP